MGQIDEKVLRQIAESCVITHEMQMRVYQSGEKDVLRIELCVNYHTVCEFEERLQKFNEIMDKAAGYAPLYWDQISELEYQEYN